MVVVAPLANHSGAGAAVGPVYERQSIAFRTAAVEGAEHVPAVGLDASPALAVIVAVLGGVGPPPDLVVSGINLGVNVGRSVLHSGTVGAALTASQLGRSALAVSMRSGAEVEHWDTAGALAGALVPVLAAAPARTVLNLNVPSVPLDRLRGVRRAVVSSAGLVKAADPLPLGPRPAGFQAGQDGEIEVRLGPAVPSLGPGVEDEDPEEDAALVAHGFAALTAVRTVSVDPRPEVDDLVAEALDALAPLAGGAGRG